MDNSKLMKIIIDSLKENSNKYSGLYLYGSRAKNSENELSDYDIIYLTDKKPDSEVKYQIYKIIGRLEGKLNIFIDIQILTKDEFLKNPFFYEEVTKYGKFYAV